MPLIYAPMVNVIGRRDLDNPDELDLAAILSYENPHRERYDQLTATLVSRNERRTARRRSPGFMDRYQAWLERYSMRRPFQTFYSALWTRAQFRRDEREWLAEQINGYPLADLGGGDPAEIFRSGLDFFPRLASFARASEYIDVDRYLRAEGEPNLMQNAITEAERTQAAQRYPGTRVTLVHADMLDFISRLPNRWGEFRD